MLPENHHPHDKEWITQQLKKVPVGYRGSVALKYSAAYREAYTAEPIDHMKENKARFAANTRLRVYIEKTQSIAKTN